MGMVQVDEVAQIIKRWKEAGSVPCAHERVEKEYYLGSSTGDYACLDCGESGPNLRACKHALLGAELHGRWSIVCKDCLRKWTGTRDEIPPEVLRPFDAVMHDD